MRISEVEVERLAARIIDAVVRQGYVKPKRETKVLVQHVAAMLLENFQQDAALEEEAERVAEGHSRQMAGMDQRKVIQMIKRKLAEERGFPL